MICFSPYVHAWCTINENAFPSARLLFLCLAGWTGCFLIGAVATSDVKGGERCTKMLVVARAAWMLCFVSVS